jgi:hypothetical protein
LLSRNINIKIHKAVTVSYGCQASSLPLREEHWIKVIKNIVLRKTFKYKRKSVTKSRRRVLKEKHLYVTKYYSCARIMKDEMVRTCSVYGIEKKCLQGFVEET